MSWRLKFCYKEKFMTKLDARWCNAMSKSLRYDPLQVQLISRDILVSSRLTFWHKKNTFVVCTKWDARCRNTMSILRYEPIQSVATFIHAIVGASLPASMLMSGAKFYFDLVVTKFPIDTDQKLSCEAKTTCVNFSDKPTPSVFFFQR